MLKLQKEDYKSNALKDFARLYERESGKQLWECIFMMLSRKGSNFKNIVVSQDSPRLMTYLDPMIKSMGTSLHHDFQKYSDASRNRTFGKCYNDYFS